MMRAILLCSLLFASTLGRKGYGPTDQEWGFVTVRDGAHMFWWLHYTTATEVPTDKPVIIWLQGGPGASSTGYGNFAELGPLDSDLKPRNSSWTSYANLLLVDNPVGAGYSYGDSKQNLATTNLQIATDFVNLLKEFFEALSQFENTPLYIFSESYGGKMTAEIALQLDESIANGNIRCNFKGVGLGDSSISPVDSVLTWAPYLLHIGAIDQKGYDAIDAAAKRVQRAIAGEDYEMAEFYRWYTEFEVMIQSDFVDFYNVLKKIPCDDFRNKIFKPSLLHDKIRVLMNGPVKEALGLDVYWGRQSRDVFSQLISDIMKPVTSIVEELLNSTRVKVAVYNGQLDLIVDTPGTLKWVDRLSWTQSSEWKITERTAFAVNGFNEGYEKKLGNFAMYWVNRAGHMVPADNPEAMKYILEDVTNKFEV